MPDDIFDAVIVGAGPAGSACALTAAAGGANVALLERGEYPGAKNVQGAVLYAKHLDAVVPQFWKDPSFPGERNITEQRVVVTSGREDWINFSFRGGRYKTEPPNCFTIIRTKFDQWFAKKAEEKGAQLFTGVTVSEPIRTNGSVKGVKTSDAEELNAHCVVACDGVNSLIAQKLGVIDEWKMDEVAMGVKEVLAIPKEKIDDRFALEGNEGLTIEFFGSISQGMIGYAFLYTNKESLSLGVGAKLSDLRRKMIKPYDLLDFVKTHPLISRLIKDAKPLEYSAHLIPEGGLHSMPPLYGDGFLIAGDAAQMVNPTHREGSNLAMTAGHLAGQTIVEAKKNNDFSKSALAAYERKIKASYVWPDLWEHRNVEKNVEKDPSILEVYPRLLCEAMYHHFTADDRPKKEHKKETMKMFLKERGLFKMIQDAWRLRDAIG
ncbi:MAG: FAD-dependent monooxygenase [Elusimicrobia bacterium]|nr:FAD-dependent monooxygenase [Elusimicrobiota bacterium]